MQPGEISQEVYRLLGLKDPVTLIHVHEDGTETTHEISRKFWGVTDFEIVRGLQRLLNQSMTEAALAVPFRPLPGCVMPTYKPAAPQWRIEP